MGGLKKFMQSGVKKAMSKQLLVHGALQKGAPLVWAGFRVSNGGPRIYKSG